MVGYEANYGVRGREFSVVFLSVLKGRSRFLKMFYLCKSTDNSTLVSSVSEATVIVKLGE